MACLSAPGPGSSASIPSIPAAPGTWSHAGDASADPFGQAPLDQRPPGQIARENAVPHIGPRQDAHAADGSPVPGSSPQISRGHGIGPRPLPADRGTEPGLPRQGAVGQADRPLQREGYGDLGPADLRQNRRADHAHPAGRFGHRAHRLARHHADGNEQTHPVLLPTGKRPLLAAGGRLDPVGGADRAEMTEQIGDGRIHEASHRADVQHLSAMCCDSAARSRLPSASQRSAWHGSVRAAIASSAPAARRTIWPAPGSASGVAGRNG